MEEKKGLVRYKARDGQTITLSFEIVREFLVQGKKELMTPAELMFFMGVCKSRGLNPFKRDAYLIKYGSDPAAVVTSIDYFRSRARAQRDCRGWKSGVIVRRRNETVEHREGHLIMEEEVLLGGWFSAKPDGWEEPLFHSVNLKPYIKTTREGAATRFWSPENQPMMIQKVAEAQGLRKLWPDEFQQIYVENEIQPQSDDVLSGFEPLKEPRRKSEEKEKPEKSDEAKQPILAGMENGNAQD